MVRCHTEAPGLVGFCLGSGLADLLLAWKALEKKLLVLGPRERSPDRSGGGWAMTYISQLPGVHGGAFPLRLTEIHLLLTGSSLMCEEI